LSTVAATSLPRSILGHYIIGVGVRMAWWGRARPPEGRARISEGHTRLPDGRAWPLEGRTWPLRGAHGPLNAKPSAKKKK
jgi:hypothetical protein